MGQHSGDLARNSHNFTLVSDLLETLGRKICITCNRITLRCTAEGFCDKCDEKRPVASKIVMDLTESQRHKSTEELKAIQKTKLRLRRTITRKLCTLWSDIMTDIALGMADASKESEPRRALRRYLMVKAVLIQPMRGGGCRQNRNLNQTERLMHAFFEGKEEEVWQTAVEIEKTRQKKRATQRKRNTKRSLTGDKIERKPQKSEVKIRAIGLRCLQMMESLAKRSLRWFREV